MLRRARTEDADAIAAVFADSRAEAMPWLPVLHTPAEDRRFFRDCIRRHEVWVAENDGRVVGFAVVTPGSLEHLYVAPGAQRRGVGTALFAQATRSSPAGLRFWVFQRNERARRFYEGLGASVVEMTGGAANEEREPDALYEWRPDLR